MKRTAKWEKLLLVVLVAVYVLLLIGVFSQKKGYHMDELYTYGLSNNTAFERIAPEVYDGDTYTPADEIYMRYMTVSPEHTFSYWNVIAKNSMDVHPPVYYALVHTVCSFFPGSFSLWYGATVNIALAVVNLLLLWCVLSVLIPDKKIVYMALIAYALSAGIANTVVFLRMYILVTTWLLALTYIFLLKLKNRIPDWLFIVLVYGFSTCGELTHYYTAIFLIGYCAMVGVYFLKEKKYWQLLWFAAAMALAVVSVLVLYPACTTHIFHGLRGTDVQRNLLESSAKLRFTTFFRIVRDGVLGGLVPLVVAGVVLLVLVCYRLAVRWGRKAAPGRKAVAETAWQLAALTIPATVYFLLVSKTASFMAERYICPIYPQIFAALVFLIYKLAPKKRAGYSIIAAVLVICTVFGWKNCKWENLFRQENSKIAYAKSHTDMDCLVVVDKNGSCWQLLEEYAALAPYRSATFVTQEKLVSGEAQLPSGDDFAVFILSICDTEQVLNALDQQYASSADALIGKGDFFNAWHMTKE